MIDRLTLHYTLQDIADYFRECFKNASPGSSAQARFDRYIVAAEEADRLLKEQEPRVMTPEEAINGNQVGYVEFRYHPDRGWVKCDFTCLDDEVVMMLSSTKAFYQSLLDYKQLWRLWTSRPTYEQMKATPWEMPEAITDGQN